MPNSSNFDKFFPKITEQTIVQAAASYGVGGEIISLDGRETAINAFVMQLATDSEVHGPFLLNAECARALFIRLQKAGFGPQE